MASQLEIQTTVGRNIGLLAVLCESTTVPPNDIHRLLSEATIFGTRPIAQYLPSLMKVQRTYANCVGYLKRFPEADRKLMHQVILERTRYLRYSAFAPAFKNNIEKKEMEIQGRNERIKQLQYRIEHGIGDKLEQKTTRDRLLQENSYAGTELTRMKKLQEEVAIKAQKALVEANLLRVQLGTQSKEIDISIFKAFEEIIRDRETIKANFFLGNNWTTLFLDCKVQNAFDSILRAAAPTPITFWEWVCCCLTSRTRKF